MTFGFTFGNSFCTAFGFCFGNPLTEYIAGAYKPVLLSYAYECHVKLL